jgi:hypothetical protein
MMFIFKDTLKTKGPKIKMDLLFYNAGFTYSFITDTINWWNHLT